MCGCGMREEMKIKKVCGNDLPAFACITEQFFYFSKQFLAVREMFIERKIMRRLKGPVIEFFFLFVVQELVVDRFTE